MKIKRKGRYEYQGLGQHQNHSALIIPMAAEQELVYGNSCEEFIKRHDVKWDFLLRTKVQRSHKLVLVMLSGEEVKQQNICRYYVANEGGSLVKVMPPLEGKEEGGDRRTGIEVGWYVKTCNDINDFDWDINYDYYIKEARKLIDIFDQERENK